jgi:hypothetical protein
MQQDKAARRDGKRLMQIAIVGAGMAGLRCGMRVAAAGHDVRLFDKGRGPGGRMATRRMALPSGGEAAFDHGAQYITAKTTEFAAQLADWASAGVIAPWPAAGEGAFVGVPGMNAVLKAMAAGLNISWGTEITGLAADDGGWRLAGAQGVFEALVVAVPPEQAARLLSPVDPRLADLAGSVRSAACWTLMAAFAAPLTIADVLRSEGIIGWAARNSAKPGRSSLPEAWVVQATPEWSAAHLEDAPEAVSAALLAALTDRLGPLPALVAATAHRWRYAQSAGTEDGALWQADARLGVCGDWLLGPRVEDAWTSGHMLAGMIR